MKQGKHEVYLRSISFSYTVGAFHSGSVYKQLLFFKKKSEHFKPDKSPINIVLFTCMSGGYAGQQSEGFCRDPSG